VPAIDEANKIVNLTLFVDPGSRVYVRHINFTGTTRSNDETLRREMRQLEGAWLSNVALERSKQRLQRLAFVESVEMTTEQVPGSPDLVDVGFAIKERPSATHRRGYRLFGSTEVRAQRQRERQQFLRRRGFRRGQRRFRRLQQDLQLERDRPLPDRRRTFAHDLFELPRFDSVRVGILVLQLEEHRLGTHLRLSHHRVRGHQRRGLAAAPRPADLRGQQRAAGGRLGAEQRSSV
jgi:hypothetical protein